MTNWVELWWPGSPPFPQKFPFPPIAIPECPSLTSLSFDLFLNRVSTEWQRNRIENLAKNVAALCILFSSVKTENYKQDQKQEKSVFWKQQMAEN